MLGGESILNRGMVIYGPYRVSRELLVVLELQRIPFGDH